MTGILSAVARVASLRESGIKAARRDRTPTYAAGSARTVVRRQYLQSALGTPPFMVEPASQRCAGKGDRRAVA